MKLKISKIGALMMALAIALTAVFVSGKPAMAASDYTTLVEDTAGTASAGVPNTYSFTVSTSAKVSFSVYVPQRVGFTLEITNSAGTPVGTANYISESDSYWEQDSEYGIYANGASMDMSAGDYVMSLTFDADTQYLFFIDQMKPDATISNEKITVTAGFTQKLSVQGGKVKSWKSNKTSIATVNSKGVVTGKKAGKATVTATTTDGVKLKCVVTVKANKYTATKITNANRPYGDCFFSAYSASYDSKGNLVIKANFVNNINYKVVQLKGLKITVTNAKGKTVGTYSDSSKSVAITGYTSKAMSFTIKKADLKIKTADLRNSTIKITGDYIYQY